MAVISILIPCYNAGPFLNDTIRSVVQQSFADWEVVILDDCSTDESAAIAQEWVQRDSRIRFYRNDANLGMMENWNKGIDLCHAPYFVKLDADDIWHPQMLEKALKVLQENKEVAIVFSRFEDIDDAGKVSTQSAPLPSFARNKAFDCVPLVQQGPEKMLSYNILRQGLSVMRRSVFDEIGKYRYLLTKETQAATDTDFYFRVGAHYKIYCIDEVLYQYRVHADSISAQDARNLLHERKNYELKHCIIEYYYEKGLLGKEQRNTFLNETDTLFRFISLAHIRKNERWPKFLKAFVEQAVTHPVSTFKFYSRRLQEK